MNNLDYIAIFIFLMCWFGVEPILLIISKKSGLINKDLTIIRLNWMRAFTMRDVKIFDSNLLGHSINSASFFASANLLIIAAIAGAIFEGQIQTKAIQKFGIENQELQLKLILILICLTRGLLNFIWSLRQLNYCAAAFGACPDIIDNDKRENYALALADIVEPAMSNFSRGVRAYYFALAAGAWLYGPWFLIFGSVGAFGLLAFRQSKSQAAKGIRKLRNLLEESNDNN
ncbi:MAG: DUF599 family protein [Caulobacterales bacterium]|nr:DUF599 family protein [Caulobacterales bacterium]